MLAAMLVTSMGVKVTAAEEHPGATETSPTKLGEYKSKVLKENIAELDEMIEKLSALGHDRKGPTAALLSSVELKVLIAETELQMGYIDARLKDGTTPRIWISNLRDYPYSLSSIHLCGQMNAAYAAFVDNKSARDLSGRLRVLANKWCGHAFSLAKLYEIRDMMTRYGEKGIY